MKKTVLDNYVILYSENKSFDFLELIDKINNELCARNIWEISSANNINQTNHTNSEKVINLNIADNLFSFINDPASIFEKVILKKNNLKYLLNKYSFDFILDYLKEYEKTIKKVKNWTVCENYYGTDFHDDENKNGLKHSHTIVICLDSEYEGGEFQFKNRIGNEKIKMMPGDVLIYPSNSDYQHKENPVLSGKKYTATAYF